MPDSGALQPIVVARRVTFRGLLEVMLAPITVTLLPGECWVVTGPNGSGKSVLTELLAGLRSPSGGELVWPGLRDPRRDCAVVSFEAQERVIARERREDESSILDGRTDPGRTVGRFLREAVGTEAEAPARALARRFGIDHLTDRGLRFLSTGEFRKTLLAAAVAREPRLLVLDEPYDGLDVRARGELEHLIADLHADGRCLVVVANRRRDIPVHATHIVELTGGVASYVGPAAGWTQNAGAPEVAAPLAGDRHAPVASAKATAPGTAAASGVPGAHGAADRPVIRMRDVSVSYGDTPILTGVDWTVDPEDRWMVIGPNGSGKSTLLRLVTGDNPKSYGQEMDIFGRRRGSGESVWEIKRRIGYVSGDLQFAYPLRTTVLETVLSGFHDSIGLYEPPSGLERESARRWIARIGLGGWEERRLRELSFGMRRMLLVVRAVVKGPELLIADEPCQGLDDEHARSVLHLLDRIGSEHESCLLYVTHNRDEGLDCITHVLELVPGPDGSRAVTAAT